MRSGYRTPYMWAICGVPHLAGYAVFSACDGGDDDYHDLA